MDEQPLQESPSQNDDEEENVTFYFKVEVDDNVEQNVTSGREVEWEAEWMEEEDKNSNSDRVSDSAPTKERKPEANKSDKEENLTFYFKVEVDDNVEQDETSGQEVEWEAEWMEAEEENSNSDTDSDSNSTPTKERKPEANKNDKEENLTFYFKVEVDDNFEQDETSGREVEWEAEWMEEEDKNSNSDTDSDSTPTEERKTEANKSDKNHAKTSRKQKVKCSFPGCPAPPFENKKYLQHHKQQAHTFYSCPLCPIPPFTVMADHISHMTNVHAKSNPPSNPQLPYSCPLCPPDKAPLFKIFGSWRHHIGAHLSKIPTKMRKIPGILKTHPCSLITEDFVAPTAIFNIPSNVNVDPNVIINSNAALPIPIPIKSRRFICSFKKCTIEFPDSQSLKEHLKSHKKPDKKPMTYLCPVEGCSRVFFTRNHVMHVRKCQLEMEKNKKSNANDGSQSGEDETSQAPKIPAIRLFCKTKNCGEEFPDLRSLGEHRILHDTKNKKKSYYRCPVEGCSLMIKRSSVAAHARKCRVAMENKKAGNSESGEMAGVKVLQGVDEHEQEGNEFEDEEKEFEAEEKEFEAEETEFEDEEKEFEEEEQEFEENEHEFGEKKPEFKQEEPKYEEKEEPADSWPAWDLPPFTTTTDFEMLETDEEEEQLVETSKMTQFDCDSDLTECPDPLSGPSDRVKIPLPRFSCPLCLHPNFATSQDRRDHMKFVHAKLGPRKFKCELCPDDKIPFSTFGLWKHHIEGHLAKIHRRLRKKPGILHIHPSSLSNYEDFVPAPNEEDESDVKLNLGASTSTTTTATTTTDFLRNSQRFICNFRNCFIEFEDSFSLKEHEKGHKKPETYQCPVEGCTQIFRSSGRLFQHLDKCQHETKMKKQRESELEKSFEEEGGVKLNLAASSSSSSSSNTTLKKSVTFTKMTQCSVPGCGRIFRTRAGGRSHMLNCQRDWNKYQHEVMMKKKKKNRESGVEQSVVEEGDDQGNCTKTAAVPLSSSIYCPVPGCPRVSHLWGLARAHIKKCRKELEKRQREADPQWIDPRLREHKCPVEGCSRVIEGNGGGMKAHIKKCLRQLEERQRHGDCPVSELEEKEPEKEKKPPKFICPVRGCSRICRGRMGTFMHVQKCIKVMEKRKGQKSESELAVAARELDRLMYIQGPWIYCPTWSCSAKFEDKELYYSHVDECYLRQFKGQVRGEGSGSLDSDLNLPVTPDGGKPNSGVTRVLPEPTPIITRTRGWISTLEIASQGVFPAETEFQTQVQVSETSGSKEETLSIVSES